MSLLLLDTQCATQCGFQLEKMSMALDPTQPWLDVEQRGRQPAMALVRSLPGVHIVAALAATKARDNVELDKPIAPGIASAAAA